MTAIRNYDLPGPNARAVLETQAKFLSPSISTPMPLVWERAEDCRVYDVDGNDFIDFTSGVLVANTGHCHPKVVKAIQDQAGLLLNCYDSAHPLRSAFVERLAGLMPEDLDRVLLLSSGSEAIDAALKMARVSTGRDEIIGFDGAFHGRTYGAMSAGGLAGARQGFGPFLPGILRAPFPDYYRMQPGETPESVDTHCLAALEQLLLSQSNGDVAALITETYQGGGGSLVPSARFMRGVRDFCDRHGILLILDEVQASFGRTGRLFAFEHFDIVPDIVVVGKGIASGLPVAAVVARTPIMAGLKPGSLSSTFGGNPLACAAGLASIDVIVEDDLSGNAARIGTHMTGRLKALMERHRLVGDIRGMGLSLAIEFVIDKETKQPNPDVARGFVEQLLRSGLCVMAPIGRHGNVLRIAPPLTITRELADEGLDIIEASLQAF
ncbi:aspartate aminotransferase family protein [Bauldia litoralis]|uniref:aspartate aminotransferase family protein n=1 Tax=Bauldia litoralis TaxID=665467 RepID=UPI00326591E7